MVMDQYVAKIEIVRSAVTGWEIVIHNVVVGPDGTYAGKINNVGMSVPDAKDVVAIIDGLLSR
jgi:hypothetical protein